MKHHSQRQTCCSILYKWRNAIFLLGAVYIDSLLTWKVYFYAEDITFFVFGLLFTLVPLLVLSIGISCQHPTHYLQGIPLVNILWILSLNNNKTKIMQIAVSVLMSFPQYILNDAFILSKRDLTVYSKLQLLASYIVIMFGPLMNFSFILYEDLKHEQAKQSTSNSDASGHPQRNGYHVTNYRPRSNAYLYCKALLSTAVVLPLILIELIHFFPVLLEYCYYAHLGVHDLCGNMVLFNIFKFPIAVIAIYIARHHQKNDRRHFAAVSRSSWCGWYFWMQCGIFLWCIITPLIVSVVIIKSEYSVHQRMLFLAISYITVSYGGMCAWLMLSVQPFYDGLGVYTRYCISLILILIIVDIMVLFLVDWYEYHRKGRHSKFIALPYDVTDDDEEATTQYDDSDAMDIQEQEFKNLVSQT